MEISGVLNAQTVGDLKSHIERLLKEPVKLVVLNLEELQEIDSSGIGAIVSLLKRMRMNKNDVRIYKLQGTVRKLFELLRIDKSMEIFDDLEAAIAL
ncbi:STAS domain-containing protein [candidate division KSB1 bacterium]|nr:STAS domain-containing protein [candidate division KSB1 bacterium]